jgi:hypothetical protein
MLPFKGTQNYHLSFNLLASNLNLIPIDDKGRPSREVLEFIPREIFVPNYVYRDILFVYPKDVNFASRTG